MLASSLLFRLTVTYGFASVLIGFSLLYAVPKHQKEAFFDDVMGELRAISQTVSNSVEIAIEEEDFSSLRMINKLLASHPNVSFAVIYVDEDGVNKPFSIFPSHLEDDPEFSLDPDRFLIHGHPIETALFNGHVEVGYDAALFERQVQKYYITMYIAFAFVLVVQFWTYRSIARAVIKPVRTAAAAADSLGGGGLRSPLQLEARSDEIGQLHNSLVNLQAHLLHQQNHNDELTATLEKRVQARTSDLNEALAAKDNFLSSVSHELRTPLHSIIASLELKVQESGTDEIVENGLLSAQLLLTLINDLLDYQRFVGHGVQLRPTTVQVSQFVSRFERMVRPLFASDDVNLRCEHSVTRDLWVSVDGKRLEQILVNLVGNACKFTQEGEVVVTVQAEAENGRARCVFDVSDTGIGIDEQMVARLGEPFFQAAEGYKRAYGGTGLGLSIVKTLLEAMGSRMEVQSVLGKGSNFSFVLELPVEEALPSYDVPAPVSLAVNEPLRLLYVEDVEMNQFFMKAMAKKLNVVLTLASSALEGYEYIKKEPFDLVLVDIQMPEHDGTELIEWVRTDPDIPSNLVVYAFTAHAEQERLDYFGSIGFDRVLTKPLSKEGLRVALEEV
ncbi:MAG: hypothetical protein CME16_05695 [Gemmatimonadetes bacterium]|nr:hypothetical protein [Gemmatimonadota bacterium]